MFSELRVVCTIGAVYARLELWDGARNTWLTTPLFKIKYPLQLPTIATQGGYVIYTKEAENIGYQRLKKEQERHVGSLKAQHSD